MDLYGASWSFVSNSLMNLICESDRNVLYCYMYALNINIITVYERDWLPFIQMASCSTVLTGIITTVSDKMHLFLLNEMLERVAKVLIDDE